MLHRIYVTVRAIKPRNWDFEELSDGVLTRRCAFDLSL